jgi:hypothetical protein
MSGTVLSGEKGIYEENILTGGNEQGFSYILVFQRSDKMFPNHRYLLNIKLHDVDNLKSLM